MGEKELEKKKKKKTFVAHPFVFIFSLCRVCKTGHVWNGCGLRPPPYFTPCVCVWVFFVETSVNTYGPEREAESQSARDQSGTAHNKQKKLYIHIIIHLSVIFILFSLFLSLFLFLRLLSSSTCQRVNKQQHGREKDREYKISYVYR